MANFCEHGNEYSRSMNDGELRDKLNDSQLLKKDPTPWNQATGDSVDHDGRNLYSHRCQDL